MTNTPSVPQAEHERLGLSFAEWIALLGTQEWVAMGAKHNPARLCSTPVDPHGHEFNMAWCCLTEGCGTVSCIGGTMALALGKHTWAYVNGQEARQNLNRLFYPRTTEGKSPNFRSITPAQALRAIYNFRRTGDADWDSVLTKSNFTEL